MNMLFELFFFHGANKKHTDSMNMIKVLEKKDDGFKKKTNKKLCEAKEKHQSKWKMVASNILAMLIVY